MLKFLRKYNKFILVVGGVLLMIAFLLPQGIQQIAQQTTDKGVATLDGKIIRLSDLAQADREINVLERLGVLSDPSTGRAVSIIRTMLDDRARDEHWLLLSRAAEKAGFIGGVEHGVGFLDELAQAQTVLMIQAQIASRIPNPALVQSIAQQQFESEEGQRMYQDMRAELLRARSRFANEARLTPDAVDQALARLRGVQRMQAAFGQSIRTSSIEAERVAAHYSDRVIADVLSIRADDLIDTTVEPTPEQLQSHFEQFRSLRPGQEGLGFGYMLPQRVKLHWLMIDRQAVSNTVTINVLDIAKAHQANREQYPGELAAERPRIENDLKRTRVNALIDLAEATIRGEVGRLMRPLPDDGDFKTLPADWTPLDLIAIAEAAATAVRSREQVEFPTPRVVRRDANWLDARGLSELEGIGRATMRIGTRQVTSASLPQVALSVRELVPETPIALQVGVPYTANKLEDAAGNRYMIMVTDAAPAAEPNSIDELINPQVVRDDWRKAQAFQYLLAQQEVLRGLAVEEGFDAVVDALFPPSETQTTTRPTVQRGVDFSVAQVRVGNQPALFDSEAVREAVRSMGELFDPMQPLEEVPTGDRTLTVPAENARSLLVVRIVGLAPLTIESFRQVRDAAVQRGVDDDLGQTAQDEISPFTFASLRERLGYQVRPNMADSVRSTSIPPLSATSGAPVSGGGDGTSPQG